MIITISVMIYSFYKILKFFYNLNLNFLKNICLKNLKMKILFECNNSKKKSWKFQNSKFYQYYKFYEL